MLQFGLHAQDVDQWVRDVGSPSELTFSLEFNGDEFSHFAMTPEQPRQVDEAGTFVYDANHKRNGGVTAGRLTLSVADQGAPFEVESAMNCCDELKLHFVDSPGNADMTAEEVVRAIPLYTSAPFHRVDDRDTHAAG
jgi:hypothetical protein